MKISKVLPGTLYTIVVFITAGMGIKFISATEYFTYHEQASGLTWAAVDPGLKQVYLAVFKVCGAGFLTVSLCLAFMVIIPFLKNNQRWSYYAIPICGTLFWSIIMLATIHVNVTTGAETPWIGSLTCVIMLVIGFVFSLINNPKEV